MEVAVVLASDYSPKIKAALAQQLKVDPDRIVVMKLPGDVVPGNSLDYKACFLDRGVADYNIKLIPNADSEEVDMIAQLVGISSRGVIDPNDASLIHNKGIDLTKRRLPEGYRLVLGPNGFIVVKDIDGF